MVAADSYRRFWKICFGGTKLIIHCSCWNIRAIAPIRQSQWEVANKDGDHLAGNIGSCKNTKWVMEKNNKICALPHGCFIHISHSYRIRLSSFSSRCCMSCLALPPWRREPQMWVAPWEPPRRIGKVVYFTSLLDLSIGLLDTYGWHIPKHSSMGL